MCPFPLFLTFGTRNPGAHIGIFIYNMKDVLIASFKLLFICEKGAHTWHSLLEEVTELLKGLGSLLPHCGSQGSDSGCQNWWQATLPTEPSHWPLFYPHGCIFHFGRRSFWSFRKTVVGAIIQYCNICSAHGKP